MHHLVAKLNGNETNYKNCLVSFYEKNGLGREYSLHFYERKNGLVIHCSVPNLRFVKRLERIIKLIAHYKKHQWKIFTAMGEHTLQEILELMLKC